ncbi:MAG: hypothetical protein KDA83_11485, partial [Planctomycetales bacterium]|nr:hypothetical protein [Planctomycetales bacterium]
PIRETTSMGVSRPHDAVSLIKSTGRDASSFLGFPCFYFTAWAGVGRVVYGKLARGGRGGPLNPRASRLLLD